ncbi:hypothetical protein FHS57_005469 [Runella defluvii]|uniref:Uncharacterized protein n=1 Tax=Runella defluvii TaxID=370973 RepID=A0A7W6ETI9_9BACT|nr:hypothetical protein [Runella defluvii]
MNDNSKFSNIPPKQLNRVVQLVAYSIIAALVGVIFTAIVLLIGLVLHA